MHLRAGNSKKYIQKKKKNSDKQQQQKNVIQTPFRCPRPAASVTLLGVRLLRFHIQRGLAQFDGI